MFNSILKRLVISAVVAALLLAGGMSLVMGSSLAAALRDAEKTKMRGFIFRVLATMEVDPKSDISLDPSQMGILRDNQSVQVVSVTDEMQREHQLLSVNARNAETLVPKNFKSVPGQDDFAYDAINGIFRLSYTVTWVLNAERQHDLSVHYFVDDAEYSQTLQKFYLWFVLALVALFFGIVLAAYFGIRWALAPVASVNAQLQALHHGQRESIDVQLADELSPLVSSMNNVLTQERARQSRFKNALADMAHSIKTPLAVMVNEIESMPQSARRTVVNEQLSRLNTIIAQQLTRAAATGTREIGHKAKLSKVVVRIGSALNRLYPHVKLENHIDAYTTVALSEDDAMEVFGNLLENAMKYGDDRVRISAETLINGERRILIEDNGPGFPDNAAALLQRGVRADTTVEGQGIGMAVTLEILGAYDIDLHLASSVELGGACLLLENKAASA